MPRRVRSHQIETESRARFRTLLNDLNWVMEDFDDDYGLDGEAEIFDSSGSATGLRFFVQLKATEQKIDKALRVRISSNHFDYYASLDRPLLIVRYHVPSRSFFVNWFHALDKGQDHRKRRSKTRSLRMTLDDRWTADMPQVIRRQLDVFRLARSSTPSLPITVNVTVLEASRLAAIRNQLISRLIAIATPCADIVLFTRVSQTDSPLDLKLSDSLIRCSAPGIADITLVAEFEYPLRERFGRLPEDALVVLALLLSSLGHPALSCRLLTSFLVESNCALNPLLLMEASSSFLRANQAPLALTVADSMRSDSELFRNATFLEMISGFARQTSRGQLSRSRVTAIESAEKHGEPGEVGMAHYNFANAVENHRLAVRHYRQAAEHMPAYLELHYWWRELAGRLFLSRRFAASSACYRKALEFENPKPITRALYADALLHSGRYQEARLELRKYFREDTKHSPEHQLLAVLLPKLMEIAGAQEQKRQTREARGVALAAMGLEIEPWDRFVEIPSDLIADKGRDLWLALKEALSLDALCDLAWAGLGASFSSNERSDEAAHAFCVHALLQRYNPNAWFAAIAECSKSPEARQAVSIVIEAALETCGHPYAELVMEMLEKTAGELEIDPKVIQEMGEFMDNRLAVDRRTPNVQAGRSERSQRFTLAAPRVPPTRP